ncbi:MAG: Ni/Fe hydrogenase subunit alpha [Phycisphaeraceae bacterium]|nr:Ni/Fe hydrogenase subunit alpha [Phycisphaeraceae bacterium]
MSGSKSRKPETRTIRVGALPRVEGEGALHLAMRDGRVEEVRLEIYEPPRFYEAFLRDRDFMEVPDITARICGICPVAYQMGACHALEKALGVFDDVDPAIRAKRNLLYCGEWIESHVLHMFMLHLPDFLGYESAISMAEDHGDVVKRALRIKKLGNELVAALAGRSVHPVGVCVGGFYRALDPARAAVLLPEVNACLDDMCALTMFLAEHVDYPDFERDYEFVALCPDDEYPFNLGPIRSSKGLDIEQEAFGDVIEERHVAHTTALQSVIRGRGAYMVGPLARLNLNAERLHPRAAELLPKVCDQVSRTLPWRNNFLSLLARGLETVHALGVAADFLASYEPPARSRIPITPRAGAGGHGTEAPRGVCWHHYATGDDGSITSARIVPPTSQNQVTIEQDLWKLAEQITDLSDDDACMRCEHLIRNYDPCISCSVHFLRFERSWHGAPATEAQP